MILLCKFVNKNRINEMFSTTRRGCLIFIYDVPEDVMGNYQIYLKFLYMIFKLHVYTNVWSGEILSSLILGLKFKLYLTFFKISSFF